MNSIENNIPPIDPVEPIPNKLPRKNPEELKKERETEKNKNNQKESGLPSTIEERLKKARESGDIYG